jgi:HEAT repeat protein
VLFHALLASALIYACFAATAEESDTVKVIPTRKVQDAQTPPQESDGESPSHRDLTDEEHEKVEKAIVAFAGDSWQLKQKYLSRLEFIGEPAVPLLATRIPSAGNDAAPWIMKALANIGGTGARAALCVSARALKGQPRLVAISQLSAFKDADTAAELAELAKSDDTAVRTRAVGVLARLGIAEAADPLVASLRDSDSTVAITAKTGLLSLSKKHRVKGIAKKVVKFWQDSGKTPDATSLRLLGELGDEYPVDYLNLLFDRNPDDSAPMAALAMGKIGSKNAIRFLSRKIKTHRRKQELQIAAIEALGHCRDKRDRYAMPALLSVVDHESEKVRDAATASLGKITGLKFGKNAARWHDWWTRELWQLEQEEKNRKRD